MSMNTIALELVPPNVDLGKEKAVEDAHKALEYAGESGMAGRIRHLMIPGMIEEEDDRPVDMKPKMDTLEFWKTIQPELPGMSALCTQVTAFLDEGQLAERVQNLRGAGMDGIIFVGVPRTMADFEGPGMAPTDALVRFQDIVPNRGAILIPTREGELGRFRFKCERGATFGMTQLLFSDAIVAFLSEFAEQTPHRPEILLSFGFVPNVEKRVKLIDWLIQDRGNEAVAKEQEFVAELAERSAQERRAQLVDLYRRVVDGIGDLGFPLSVHLEAPYGFTRSAFDTFSEMLRYWAPAASPGGR